MCSTPEPGVHSSRVVAAHVVSASGRFSGYNYSLEMVDYVFCGLFFPQVKWDWSRDMRNILACDNRATSWGVGGSSGERTRVREVLVP